MTLQKMLDYSKQSDSHRFDYKMFDATMHSEKKWEFCTVLNLGKVQSVDRQARESPPPPQKMFTSLDTRLALTFLFFRFLFDHR